MSNSIFESSNLKNTPLLVWLAICVCLLHAAQCSIFLFSRHFLDLIAWTAFINFALAFSLFARKKITLIFSLLNLLSALGIFALYSLYINPEFLTLDYYQWAITDKSAFISLVEASVKKAFVLWLFFYSLHLRRVGYLR